MHGSLVAAALACQDSQPGGQGFFSAQHSFLLPPPTRFALTPRIMAASAQTTLENIERRRVQLQENIEKLRRSLTHWTTWEAEYQQLKEGIEDVEDASPAQVLEIAQSLDSSLLDMKEVEELAGTKLKTKRTANQVVDMISKRIDYVQQNCATLEKQLDASEKQLAGVDVLLEPGVDNEEGLPMMDIEEELDEDGNEITSSVNQTGKNAAELVEVLRKAGIRKAELEKQKEEAGTDQEAQKAPAVPKDVSSREHLTTTASSQIDTPHSHVEEEEEEARPVRKTVAFAQDSYSENIEKLSSLEKLQRYGYSEDLAITDPVSASHPIIPQDESPEDAELRRQMLQYGLSEVGNIVAELDLDHPTAEYTDDEDEDYEYGTDDDEEEDQYGRSTRRGVTDDIRKEMMELEKRLNARMMENVGPASGEDTLAEHADEIRTMRVRQDEQFDETLASAKPASTEPTKKKGVRFADELDVSDPAPAVRQETPSQLQVKPAATISNTIVERSATQSSTAAAPSKPGKVSRFKSGRAGTPQPAQMLPTPPVPQAPVVPTGPSGRTLATTVVEHDPSLMDVREPDEFDPVNINREIQADYHKARNRFIQQQGGFKPTQEDINSPLLEERNGKTKKVSRFMASRLNAGDM